MSFVVLLNIRKFKYYTNIRSFLSYIDIIGLNKIIQYTGLPEQTELGGSTLSPTLLKVNITM